MTENEILKALSNVTEPDLQKDIVTLNMVRDIIIRDNVVSFTIVLTTPACPLKEVMRTDCIKAIQQVDKKIPLENIAKARDLRLDSLLEEMETIAASGTKLNLDYAIDTMLDDYEQEEIIDYFKGCETSSLEVAQQELSDSNYNWEQLKIMRIKFLSVYGN